MSPLRLLATLLPMAAAAGGAAGPVRDLSGVLQDGGGIHLESLRLRWSYFDQRGRGHQSQADRPAVDQPGSERLTVHQVQTEVTAKNGRFTHRIWVPVDVVSGASPDALDAVSGSSRVNEAGSLEIETSYQVSEASAVSLRAGVHVEEPFRSWLLGAGFIHSFAEGNTTLAGSLNQSLDWFDRFDLGGRRQEGVYRSSTNLNVGVSQLLSPTTVVHLGYGATLQLGELSNTWNAVPLASGALGLERLPGRRQRHAFVGRVAQALPWRAALKGHYRLYADDWGMRAHAVEGQLAQHLTRRLHVRGSYRHDVQNGVQFFNIRASPAERFRTADSDLAPFRAHTLGLLLAIEVDLVASLSTLRLDVGYEHFVRSNQLTAEIYTCGFALEF
jgi:Protein of unknown function (DUF3570)